MIGEVDQRAIQDVENVDTNQSWCLGSTGGYYQLAETSALLPARKTEHIRKQEHVQKKDNVTTSKKKNGVTLTQYKPSWSGPCSAKKVEWMKKNKVPASSCTSGKCSYHSTKHCPICGKKLNTESLTCLKKHLFDHHYQGKDKLSKCKLCPFKCKVMSMRSHYVNKHPRQAFLPPVVFKFITKL